MNQDHLLNFLRRDDAPELPEVGLQAAATRLSQVLLQKLAFANDPEANLDSYSHHSNNPTTIQIPSLMMNHLKMSSLVVVSRA